MVHRVCISASALQREFKEVGPKISLQVIGSFSVIIEQAIVDLTEFSIYGGCKFPTEMIAGIRSLSKHLIRALDSLYSRVSSAAIDLITSLSDGLGSAFEPLISLFLPTLLMLCVQVSQAVSSQAKACILAVIKNTQSPSILPFLAESVHHKYLVVRSVAAEGVLACLNCFSSPDGPLIEDVIKSTSQDTSASIRATREKIVEAYRARFPDIAESLIAPQSDVGKKDLEDQGTPSQLTSQASRCGVTTEGKRPVGSSARPGPSLIPRRRDVTRPSAPTTQRPQRVGNKGLSCARPTTSRVHPEPGPSSGMQNRKTRPLSVKPSSVVSLPKSAVAQSDLKNNRITSSVKPSSRTRPLPSAKAEHPTTRGTVTSSRIPRQRRPSTKEVKLKTMTSQTSRERVAASRMSQQGLGRAKPTLAGRPVTKVTKPVVKMLPRTLEPARKPEHILPILPPSLTLFTARPITVPVLSSSPCLPRRLPRFEPAELNEPPIVPRDESYSGCRLPRATLRPCRRDSRSTIPLTSTPLRSFLSPLSPLQIHGAEIIAHTHSPAAHSRISCFRGCEMRYVLERFDRSHRTPSKCIASSTPRRSLSSPLSSLQIFGVKSIAHIHSPAQSHVSCFQGCNLREVLERLDI